MFQRNDPYARNLPMNIRQALAVGSRAGSLIPGVRPASLVGQGGSQWPSLWGAPPVEMAHGGKLRVTPTATGGAARPVALTNSDPNWNPVNPGTPVGPGAYVPPKTPPPGTVWDPHYGNNEYLRGMPPPGTLDTTNVPNPYGDVSQQSAPAWYQSDWMRQQYGPGNYSMPLYSANRARIGADWAASPQRTAPSMAEGWDQGLTARVEVANARSTGAGAGGGGGGGSNRPAIVGMFRQGYLAGRDAGQGPPGPYGIPSQTWNRMNPDQQAEIGAQIAAIFPNEQPGDFAARVGKPFGSPGGWDSSTPATMDVSWQQRQASWQRRDQENQREQQERQLEHPERYPSGATPPWLQTVPPPQYPGGEPTMTSGGIPLGDDGTTPNPNQYVANAARLLGPALAGNPFITPEGLARLRRGYAPLENEIQPAFYHYTSPVIQQALAGLRQSVGYRPEEQQFTASQFQPRSLY